MDPVSGKGKDTTAVRGWVDRIAAEYSPREIVGVSTVSVIERSVSGVSLVLVTRSRMSRGRPGPFHADCCRRVSEARAAVSAEAGHTPNRTSTVGMSRRRRRI
jgi:hypothetical protein